MLTSAKRDGVFVHPANHWKLSCRKSSGKYLQDQQVNGTFASSNKRNIRGCIGLIGIVIK